MADYNKLSRGEFNPHRTGITASDSAVPVAPTAGLNTRGGRGVIIDASGTFTAATLEALFWSAASGKFVSQIPAKTQAITAACQWVIDDCADRIVWVKITSLSASTSIDLNAAEYTRNEDAY